MEKEDPFLMAVNDTRTINAWCMYDWANSAYSLVITATIFRFTTLVSPGQLMAATW